jgi:hypothetical protein
MVTLLTIGAVINTKKFYGQQKQAVEKFACMNDFVLGTLL